jgi:hypothetical protein
MRESAQTNTPRETAQGWADALDRARTDLGARRMHKPEDVLREIEADIAEMEADVRGGKHGPVPPR